MTFHPCPTTNLYQPAVARKGSTTTHAHAAACYDVKICNNVLRKQLPAKVEGSEVKAQLLMALAWFHGVVQERRVFKPQGWTKDYDFSVGDLR